MNKADVAKIRGEMGWSRGRLATLLGTSERSLREIENGRGTMTRAFRVALATLVWKQAQQAERQAFAALESEVADMEPRR